MGEGCEFHPEEENMSYITLAEAKTYLGIDGTAEDALLTSLIDAAQQVVENHCLRRFEADSAEVYTFTCEHIAGRMLILGCDLAEPVSVVNGDGATLAPADYTLLPRHRRPGYAIELEEQSGVQWVTTAPIQVTGYWAYSSTPPEVITYATKDILGSLYHMYDRQGTLQDAPLALTELVKHLLSGYRKR